MLADKGCTVEALAQALSK
jgi:hypothetical protein